MPGVIGGFNQINLAAVPRVVAPQCALNLRVPGVANQHAFNPAGSIARHFHVHLGDQRTGRIKYLKSATIRLVLDGTADSVRTKDHRGIVGHLLEFFDKYRTAVAQAIHHIAVMNHLVANINRRAEDIDGTVDNLDRSIDPSTKPPRIGQFNLHCSFSGAGLTARIETLKYRSRPARG